MATLSARIVPRRSTLEFGRACIKLSCHHRQQGVTLARLYCTPHETAQRTGSSCWSSLGVAIIPVQHK
eukprot:5729762-Amphidinium_carterae.1